MKSFYNTKLEIALGIVVLATCFVIHVHTQDNVAEATPACTHGTCTMDIPNTQEFRLAALCDLADQSDTLMISCVFDHDDPQEKTECLKGVHTLDEEVLKLKTVYEVDFGEFPLCPENFKAKWNRRQL